MVTPNKTFRYLELPAEIRNIIMKEVYEPGDIYAGRPCPAPVALSLLEQQKPAIARFGAWLCNGLKAVLGEKNAEDNSIADKLHGFQLLAACRQTLREGEHLFYGQNVFHLPHGPLEDTLEWVNKFQPEHKNMIKTVCMTLSLDDLTPTTFDDWELWRKARGYDWSNQVSSIAYYLQVRLWHSKLKLLREWETLQTIYVQAGGETFRIKGESLRDGGVDHLMHVTEFARREVRTKLKAIEGEIGKVALRVWLVKRGSEGPQ